MGFHYFIDVMQRFYHIRVMTWLIKKYTDVRNYLIPYFFRIKERNGVFNNACVFQFFNSLMYRSGGNPYIFRNVG